MSSEKKLPEPGEFTRAFKLQHSGGQSGTDAEKKASEASGLFAAPGASSADPVTLTDMKTPSLPPPPTLRGPASGGTPSAESGEFTQYFTGGLPAKPTSGGGSGQRSTYGVQRPSTPVPPRNPTSDSGFNFTERFAPKSEGTTPLRATPDEYGVHNPRMGPAPDLSKRPSGESGPFDFKPTEAPAQKDTRGEYTKLFGNGELPPAPRPSAVAAPPAAPIMTDSPSFGNGTISARTMPDVPAMAPAQSGRSEFTEIYQGRKKGSEAGAASEEAAANNAAAAATKKTPALPVSINVSPVNPMAGLGGGGSLHVPAMPSAHASLGGGAGINTPFGGAHVQAPTIPPVSLPAAGVPTKGMSDNTKLILFFGILAILAVILVVVVVAMQKN